MSESRGFVDRAEMFGRERGAATGSWVVDGNTRRDAALRIISGYEDGDPEVMDLCPDPLSGEWADDLAGDDVLREVGFVGSGDPDRDDSDVDSILCAFEFGFQDGFWGVVLRDAGSVVG